MKKFDQFLNEQMNRNTIKDDFSILLDKFSEYADINLNDPVTDQEFNTVLTTFSNFLYRKLKISPKDLDNKLKDLHSKVSRRYVRDFDDEDDGLDPWEREGE